MIKKFFMNAIITSATICAITSFSLTAAATTVDDVAAVARSYGYSEDLIMQGYNHYYQNPGKYTSADFDLAIAELHKAGGVIVTTGVYDPSGYQTTTTTAAPPVTTTSKADSSGTSSTVTTTADVAVPEPETPDSDEITLTMNDGTTFKRMSSEAFIKLSYDDKMAYLRTFTPEQQQIIINNLSPEEYRSLLKQLPTDQKMEVIDNLSNAVDSMGMNITVDEISDDSISVAMRNEEGDLLGVANAGVIVEDTGYDRRGLFAVAGALFTASIAAVFFVLRKCFRNEKIGE